MNWLDRLERRFGNWGIPQFALLIVTANGLIYLLSMSRPDFLYQLVLSPEAVRAGQWWRVITFLFVPPHIAPLWMMFWLLVLYQFALALENEWGNFRFCVFYAIGAMATVLTAFIIGEPLSNVPLNTTLFLAFATLYPDTPLLLFFIIPIKVKYLAWFSWAGIVVSVIFGSLVTRAGIAASLVNYFLFFGGQLWDRVKLRVAVIRNRRRFEGRND
jgi:membrane associated rhomboid family serine protease